MTWADKSRNVAMTPSYKEHFVMKFEVVHKACWRLTVTFVIVQMLP